MENDPGKVKNGLPKGDVILVVAASLALMFLSSVPAIAGSAIGAIRGQAWTGRIHLSPGDLAVYLSSIAQAARGRFAFADMATTDGILPTPNLVWSLAGLVSLAFGSRPLAAYHVLRLLLIPAFAVISWIALAHFVRERTARVAAFLLLLFGSGFGAVAAPFLGQASYVNGNYRWPTDLWVGESNVFLSAMYSPHFVASWMLFILALYLLSRAFDEKKPLLGAFAGVSALGLFSFHPFYAATLYAVGGCWLALALRRGKPIAASASAYALFIAVSLPAAAYYLWLAKFTPNGSFMVGSNLLWTPSLAYVFLGFGGFLILAAIGRVTVAREGRTRADELAVWAAVTLVLCYAGFTYERRLLEGLEFPLAALSGLAVSAGIARFAAMKGIGRPFAVSASAVFFASVFFPSTFYAVITPIALFRDRPQLFYFSRSEDRALEWARTRTPQDAVFLSTAESGNDILGWGERRVYAGHWAATPDIGAKRAFIEGFFGSTATDRAALMKEISASYAFQGPEERAMGGDLYADRSLERAFSDGDFDIYRIKR